MQIFFTKLDRTKTRFEYEPTINYVEFRNQIDTQLGTGYKIICEGVVVNEINFEEKKLKFPYVEIYALIDHFTLDQVIEILNLIAKSRGKKESGESGEIEPIKDKNYDFLLETILSYVSKDVSDSNLPIKDGSRIKSKKKRSQKRSKKKRTKKRTKKRL